jgi:mRNA interferase MazF
VSPRQGEIWWAEAEDKRRPVLIVTRSEAIPVLTWLVVAPVTRTVRAIPTEVPLGEGEGLPAACVASFDNLQPIRKRYLVERAGRLGEDRRREICASLAALADC